MERDVYETQRPGPGEPAGAVDDKTDPTAADANAQSPQDVGRDAPADPDKAALRRAYDELEAAKRRVQRDAKRELTDQRDKLLGELLPVLDNLDRSLESAGDAAGPLCDGVKLVRRQLMSVLEGYGLERLDAVGRRFDPHLHDALATVTVDDPRHDGVVVDEWQPGYAAHGRVLRPAKVRVGKLAPS